MQIGKTFIHSGQTGMQLEQVYVVSYSSQRNIWFRHYMARLYIKGHAWRGSGRDDLVANHLLEFPQRRNDLRTFCT